MIIIIIITIVIIIIREKEREGEEISKKTLTQETGKNQKPTLCLELRWEI